MAVNVGQLIEASQYNALADLCNTIYADMYPGRVYDAIVSGAVVDNVAECNAIFSIHESENPTVSPGVGPFSFTSNVETTDFIVVIVGNEAKVGSGYTIDYTANTITFSTSIPASTRVVVFNRTIHRFGYGNSAVINNLAVGTPVESVHTNGLIDRTNASLTHVGDNTQITNVAVGQDITANDGNTIETLINSSLIQNNVHLTVGASVASENLAGQFTRTGDWTIRLEGIFAYTFSSYSEARYFFNSGGEIRFNLDMTGNPANTGYLNWNSICNQLGTVRMNHDNTLQSGTGGISNAKGFYHLTDSFQTIYSSALPSGGGYGGGYGGGGYGGSGYASLRARFYARYVTTGAGGHQIQIRCVLDDSVYHPDPITGTTTYYAKIYQPDSITKNSLTYSINAPTVSVGEDFDSGDDS